MNFDFEKQIILEDDLLLIRPILIADIPGLLPIALADRTMLQYSPKQVHTKELLTEYVHTAIALRTEKIRYTFSIVDKRHDCLVGSTAFLNIANPDDRLEIGATWLDKQFQGTGLNRRCKYLLLQYAFDQEHAHRVELRTDERNLQSRRAIEKIGGKFEGILREHTLMENGFRRNTVCYSILKSEWELLKNSPSPTPITS